MVHSSILVGMTFREFKGKLFTVYYYLVKCYSSHPYECSKICTDLLSLGLNEQFVCDKVGIRSFVADPGVVSTNIVGNGMNWFMRNFLMIPVMFIVRVSIY